MCVRKNHNGKWMIDVPFERPDGARTRVRRVSPVQTRRGAQKYERQIRAALLDGTYRTKRNPAPTIAEYVPVYLRDLQSRGRKPTTLTSAEALFRNWITPRVGGRPVDEVKTADFSTVRMAMVEAGRSGKTTNNALVVLSGLVRHWHAEQDLRPPVFRVGLVKVPKTEAPFYVDDEVERLLEAARTLGPDLEVLVLLGVDAGLRMSEIRALQWTDLVLHGRAAVTVSRTREGDQEYAPKGWKSRVVPLSTRLVEALGRVVRNLKDPHVLLGRYGEPLTRRMVGRRFEKVKGEAGIEHGSFHATRHTFCTRLAARGVAPRTIQEMAGHADLTTTQRYMHATPGAADAAIAKLEEEVAGVPAAVGEGRRGPPMSVPRTHSPSSLTTVSGAERGPE